LEQQFNLVPLKKGERKFEYPKAIDYKDGDLKHKASNVTKAVMNNFYFQSFGEYKTLLEQFNLTAEEIKGEHNGKPYNGILYSVTDDRGNKLGRPFKSSLFEKEVGCDALQKHYELSKAAIEKGKIREHLRPAIGEAMKKAKSQEDFRQILKQQGIGVIFRTNEQGRIYGVTFMDYQNRAVLNGARLGKEFSANVFNDWFNGNQKPKFETEQKRIEIPKQTESYPQTATPDLFSGSVFSLLDIAPSGDDYEEETFAREQAYEDKKRRLKAKKKRGRGI
jgi:hypothetical protein